MIYTGTTGSVGGSEIFGGGAFTTSVGIAGVTVGMSVAVTPRTFPGNGIYWEGYVSAAGVVTVKVGSSITSFVVASIYDVQVDDGTSSGGSVTAVTGVAPIASTGGNTPAISIALATTLAPGAVQPDGTSITINGSGVISASTAANGPWANLTTPPNISNFTHVNGGTDTATTTAAGIFIVCPGTNANNARIWQRPVPVVPYTLTAALYGLIPAGGTNALAGIGFRESVTGKMLTVAINQSFLNVDSWTSPTSGPTFVTQPNNGLTTGNLGQNGITPIFFRMSVVVATLTVSISVDGVNFIQILSEPVTTHFTVAPDNAFFFTEFNTGSGSFTLWATLVSWAGI